MARRSPARRHHPGAAGWTPLSIPPAKRRTLVDFAVICRQKTYERVGRTCEIALLDTRQAAAAALA